MFNTLALSLPHIAPDFNFPYVTKILAIVAAIFGAVIIYVLVQVGMSLASAVSAMRGGHGSVGDGFKVAGMGVLTIALIASLPVVVLVFVNWLNL